MSEFDPNVACAHARICVCVCVCVNMIAHKDVSSNDFKITTHNLDPPSMCHNFCSKISEENSNCRSKNQRQIDKTFWAVDEAQFGKVARHGAL